MKGKRLIVTLVAAVLAVAVLLLGACSSGGGTASPTSKYGNVTSLRASGASIGSQTYLLASMIASHWTGDLGIPSTALIMSETEALKKFDTKEVEWSYSIVGTSYDAYKGTGDWQGKQVKNIRSVMNMTPFQGYYFAVRGGSSIMKIPDLLNKKIGRAEVGMAVEYYPRKIMEIGYGLTEDKIKAAGGIVLHMSYDDMRDKLADGGIDVLSVQVPKNVKSPFVLPVEQKMGVRLLPIEPEAAQKVIKEMPYMIYDSIDGGVYKLHKDPVPALGVLANFMVRSDLPDNLVYDMVASIVKHKTDFQKNLVNFPDVGEKGAMLRGLKETGVPLHLGALKWYQDNGITVDPALIAK